jgi:hypothetical protein
MMTVAEPLVRWTAVAADLRAAAQRQLPSDGEMSPAVAARQPRGTSGAGHGGDVLAAWAESLGGPAAKRSRGRLRFAFYGRVSTEDWQDPVTSRARQLQQAAMLVCSFPLATEMSVRRLPVRFGALVMR